MGMFYNKLMESAVEDVVQTPDDIGVDLDAIEKAIAGEDGIEAHRDEVEAAEEGVVGDPLEECAVIMYESEYNFNQLMKHIGINELSEYANGKDFVLEGANLQAFFDKTREVFVKMFERFTEVFTKAVANLSDKMNFDKALVKKHEKEIRAGFDKFQDWVFEDAYDMDTLNIEYAPKKSSLLELWDKAIDGVKDAGEGLVLDKAPLSNAAAVKRVSGLDVADDGKAAGEMVTQLKAKAFVKTRYQASDASGLLDTVLNILKGENDVKKLREAYKDIKEDYKKLFKWLKECQSKSAFKDDENTSANTKNIKEACLAYTAAARYEKNLQHAYFGVCLNAHKTRRSQARRMALTWQRLGSDGKKEEEPKPKNESGLLNITII